MKSIINRCTLIGFMVLIGHASMAQKTKTDISKIKIPTQMKTYVIEREIPDAGKLTSEQLKSISQKSNSVLKEMGPDIEWIQSYVTGNKIYCVYKAESAELIEKHAKKGGFPANSITEISSVISPATGN